MRKPIEKTLKIAVYARFIRLVLGAQFLRLRKTAFRGIFPVLEKHPEVDMSLNPENSANTDLGRTWLSSAEVRPTKQRLALADLLVGDGRNRHVTAESLFASASDTGAKVSLATVYNTLRAFCDAGLMNEVTVDGHRSYFDTRVDEHPHYYWEATGELTDAPKSAVAFAKEPEAPAGAIVSRVNVVIRVAKDSRA